jgi:hypothetical protein
MTPEKKKAVAIYNKTIARMRKAVATKKDRTKKRIRETNIGCHGHGSSQSLPRGSSL